MTTAILLALAGLFRADAGLDALWADLASDNEGKAARAVLRFAAKGKDATAYLGLKLRAVKADAREIAAWLKQLDSDEFDEREKGSEALGYLGKSVKPALEKALEDKPSPELRRRILVILDRLAREAPPRPAEAPRLGGGAFQIQNINGKVTIKINGRELDLTPRVIEKPGTRPEWQRAARATAVLEHLDSPEARKLLEKLADGDAEALPTKAAKEALDRLGK